MGGWNGAVCVASRAMIITGKTIWDAKTISDQWHNQKNYGSYQPELGKADGKKGYQTYMTGKWHVSIDANKIFQTVKTSVQVCPKIFLNKKVKRDMIVPNKVR